MKCKNCSEKIEDCSQCGMPFDIDSEIICMLNGSHYCDLECFFEKYEYGGDGCKTITIDDATKQEGVKE